MITRHCIRRAVHDEHDWQDEQDGNGEELWCPGIDSYPPDLHHITRERKELFEEKMRLACVKAWEQGYASGWSNASRRLSDEPNAPITNNPYGK